MTGNDEAASMVAIEAVRRLHNSCAIKCSETAGVTPEDNAIAAIYAACDIAQAFVGTTGDAIGWLRAALDVMEQGGPIVAETIQ